MKFCPKCDNIMDISRTAPKASFGTDPTTLSNTTTEKQTETDKNKEDNDNIIKVINMFKNGIDLTSEKIDYEQLIKHKEYLALKDKEKKELVKIVKSIEDEGLSAFMICKNCSYFEKLVHRTMVLNKMSKNSSDSSEQNDYSKYKFMRYDNTLPHTRDYVCKNKDCKTHKDHTLKDAKWFRPNQSSYETFYVCCECGFVWNIA